MKKNKQGAFLKAIVSHALPWHVARRLPSPELLRAWPDMVGPYLAQRSSPICLERDGRLVLAVQGAALRQELTLSLQELQDKLQQAGFPVLGIKIISSRPNTAGSGQGKALPRPELPLDEKEKLATQAQQVKDPELRAALLKMFAGPKEP